MLTTRKPKRSPGRPVASAEGDARDHLLTAATELFARQGVAATPFAAIAKRAGLTPAMMHYYFNDREHLLDCVVEEKIAPLIASVWSPVQPNASPEDLIRGVVERLVAGVERNPWIPSTWMREVLNEGGLLRSRVLRKLPFDKVRILSAAIAQAQTRGAIETNLDPVLIVFSILGLVMMHLATAPFFAEVFHRKEPKPQAIGRHITALLLHGLKPSGQ
ncbi:MAG: TetR/AcrR family transcriptional regulator [Terracidiphilus sp.]|jgi:AcrR family transcriptional regulator